jgi:hypothetical protein
LVGGVGNQSCQKRAKAITSQEIGQGGYCCHGVW